MQFLQRQFCCLLPVAGLLAAAALQAASPTPKWLVPELERRAVVTVPRQAEGAVLVTVPCDGLDLPADALAVKALYADGTALAGAVVHADKEKADVLIRLGAERERRPFCLYYGRRSAAVPAATSAAVADVRPAEPVSMRIYRPAGISATTSWDKMFYLYRKARTPIEEGLRAGFGSLSLFDGDDTVRLTKRKQSRLWIAVLKTYVFCPRPGAYQFALDGKEMAWALVDGQMAVSAVAGPAAGEWQRGPVLNLQAGVHEVEIFCFVLRQLSLRLGWGVPGRESIEPVPANALLTPFAATEVRIEHKNRSLHPNFSVRLEQAYRFRGYPEVFVPVRLENTSVNWLGGTMTCRWRFDDGKTAEGDTLQHVFPGPGLHRVTLEVADAMGFAASYTDTINCRLVQAEEFPLDGDITNLNAVYFPRDVVQPVLRLTGRTPPHAALEVWWTITGSDGKTRQESRPLTVTSDALWLTVLREEAVSLREIQWGVRNFGADIIRDVVRFERPPFKDVPVQVAGDHLVDAAGLYLVLVPTVAGEGAATPLTPVPALTRGTVLCVDDMLAADNLPNSVPANTFDRYLARLLEARPGVTVKRVTAPDWGDFPNAYGPLVKLVQTPAALDADSAVVVLSLGLPDILVARDPAQFERYLAALVDLLHATAKHPLVLVTPPPFPPDPEQLRPYAAAVRRVADVRGLPVADLFSAFLGLREDSTRAFFRNPVDLALSEAGQRLAAQLMAHALGPVAPEGQP